MGRSRSNGLFIILDVLCLDYILLRLTPQPARLRLLLLGGVSFLYGVQVVEWVGLGPFNVC